MMASVFVGVSVDGFIARRNDDLDFLPEGGGEPHGYDEFMASVDALVIGRKTFEKVLTFERWPYGDKRVVVLSSRPLNLSAAVGGVVEQMAGPPADIVSQLAASGARHLYVDGGITIQRFLRAGLIQRLIITRVPVLIGEGIPLFGALPRDVRLRHVATRHYPSGLVQSEYAVEQTPDERPEGALIARGAESTSWDELKTTYRVDGVVLALGAGVSLGAGLPTWVGLLERLGKTCLGENGDKAIEKLIAKGFSLPSIASILKAECDDGKQFLGRVRDELYRKPFPFYGEDMDQAKLAKLVELIKGSPNQTLRAIAGMCAVWNEDEMKYRKNLQINGIVNFNLDSVLRMYIRARYDRPPLVRTVERPSKSADPLKINMYQMHGLLRFDKGAGDPGKETDKLVLTEHEYFDFFNSPTSLFNYTFLYLLREHSCLFVGLSMQDDNIRRLLHYSRKERREAYEEEGESTPDAQIKALRHFAVMQRDSVQMDSLTERSLSQLGTRVLWVNDFKELPARLKETYESAGDDWEKVF